MKAFYEIHRENDSHLHVQKNKDYFFKTHFHSHLEILVVKKGSCPIDLNGQSYLLKDGDTAFFDSFDIHGYGHNLVENTQTRLLIIPLRYANKFISLKRDMRVANPVIQDANLCQTLTSIIDDFIFPRTNNAIVTAGVELFLAVLGEKLVFQGEEQRPDHNLIKEILQYLNLNFKKDVTLPLVATKFGYTEAHVSRTFHRYVGQSIKEYVNDLRVSYVQNRLTETFGGKISELIYEAGFKSVQTYYRNLSRTKRLSNEKF